MRFITSHTPFAYITAVTRQPRAPAAVLGGCLRTRAQRLRHCCGRRGRTLASPRSAPLTTRGGSITFLLLRLIDVTTRLRVDMVRWTSCDATTGTMPYVRAEHSAAHRHLVTSVRLIPPDASWPRISRQVIRPFTACILSPTATLATVPPVALFRYERLASFSGLLIKIFCALPRIRNAQDIYRSSHYRLSYWRTLYGIPVRCWRRLVETHGTSSTRFAVTGIVVDAV